MKLFHWFDWLRTGLIGYVGLIGLISFVGLIGLISFVGCRA